MCSSGLLWTRCVFIAFRLMVSKQERLLIFSANGGSKTADGGRMHAERPILTGSKWGPAHAAVNPGAAIGMPFVSGTSDSEHFMSPQGLINEMVQEPGLEGVPWSFRLWPSSPFALLPARRSSAGTLADAAARTPGGGGGGTPDAGAARNGQGQNSSHTRVSMFCRLILGKGCL